MNGTRARRGHAVVYLISVPEINRAEKRKTFASRPVEDERYLIGRGIGDPGNLQFQCSDDQETDKLLNVLDYRDDWAL